MLQAKPNLQGGMTSSSASEDLVVEVDELRAAFRFSRSNSSSKLYQSAMMKTSTAGVHQMRPFCRHSFIIIIIIAVVVIVVVNHLKSFQPQNRDFRRSKITRDRPTDLRTDGRTDGRTRPLIEMRGRI